MTRDYAKPSTTRKSNASGKKAKRKPSSSKSRRGAVPPPPPPKRGKLLFILVLLLAGFGVGIYSLTQIPASQVKIEDDKIKPGKKAPEKKAPEQAQQPEQRFKFYDLLEESEVVPPKVDTYRFKEKTKDKDYYYVVQTGSFRSSTDAERQKATIAFQGLKATINPVQNDQGSVWYRVMTGPFYTRTEMNSALDKLVAIQIEPLVKKVKK